MEFGDPIIYKCPSCGKQMQMATYISISIRSGEGAFYSDGYSKKDSYDTPDLSKCPHCLTLFFRSDVKDSKQVSIYEYDTKNVEDILEPERSDLILALKNKLAKKWQKEKTLREDLWRILNHDIRHGYEIISGDELKLWQENCKKLLSLTEKVLKGMKPEKNEEVYDDEEDYEDARTFCLRMTAELNRNLGKFDKCMEIMEQLDKDMDWIKKQYEWECKAKNPFTFELISKEEMNLEKDKKPYGLDYYKRAKKFLPTHYGRRNAKKALADFNKAESLGFHDAYCFDFYEDRGSLYLKEIKDPEKAIADFTKAIKNKGGYHDWVIARILRMRSEAYKQKGDLKKAQKDEQAALEIEKKEEELREREKKIYEELIKKPQFVNIPPPKVKRKNVRGAISEL